MLVKSTIYKPAVSHRKFSHIGRPELKLSFDTFQRTHLPSSTWITTRVHRPTVTQIVTHIPSHQPITVSRTSLWPTSTLTPCTTTTTRTTRLSTPVATLPPSRLSVFRPSTHITSLPSSLPPSPRNNPPQPKGTETNDSHTQEKVPRRVISVDNIQRKYNRNKEYNQSNRTKPFTDYNK